jgi:zinc protease
MSGTVAVFIAFVTVLLSCTPLRPPQPPYPSRKFKLVFPFAEFQLKNGARAYLLPEDSANLVSLRIRYQVGSLDDPEGQEGIAHLAEHMLFQTMIDKQTAFQRLDQLTVYHNAVTTLEATDYMSKFEPHRLAEVLQLEASRLVTRCETLSDQAFAAEKVVVTQEIVQSLDGKAGRVPLSLRPALQLRNI